MFSHAQRHGCQPVDLRSALIDSNTRSQLKSHWRDRANEPDRARPQVAAWVDVLGDHIRMRPWQICGQLTAVCCMFPRQERRNELGASVVHPQSSLPFDEA